MSETRNENMDRTADEIMNGDMGENTPQTTDGIRCCLIKDILPLYLDDVVSEETKFLVREHLSFCADCKKELEMLAQDVTLPDNVNTMLNEAKPLHLFQKRMKKRKILVCVLLSIMLLITVTALRNPALLNKGNPIPYLRAMFALNNHVPFVKVAIHEGRYDIYMTKHRESDAMIQHIETELGMEFEDYSGPSYVFSNGKETIIVEIERYFGDYTLWKVFN